MNQKELNELAAYTLVSNDDSALSGNISYKEGAVIWLRSHPFGSIQPFDREKLRTSTLLENESVEELQAEALLHDVTGHRFVAHLHSPVIDAFMCSRTAKQSVKNIFGENTIFVQYDDPGPAFHKKLQSEVTALRQHQNVEPSLIFLENNGIIIGADTAADLRKNSDDLNSRIGRNVESVIIDKLPHNKEMNRVIPVIRMLLSSGTPQVVRSRNNTLIEKYCHNQQDFHKISIPLTPATIKACRTRYMYIDQAQGAERIIESFRYQLPNFRNEYGYLPGIVVIKNAGVFAFAGTCSDAEKKLDAFEDHIKICHYALQMGGTKYLTPQQVTFIDKISSRNSEDNPEREKLKNRIAAVIAAGNTGKEIVSELFSRGLNVILAGDDEASGISIISELNGSDSPNRAVFIKTVPGDGESVKEMISATVSEFGGLDLLITKSASAGEITLGNTSPDSFASINNVNNTGFFTCAKYASEVMKLQNQADPDHFSDIIRINALQPGRSNFLNPADEGLTRMFASELAPHRIKVNTITHGHFFEDQVWSEPGKGIFAQYLKSGKIAGARNMEDVRKQVESRVPLKRGCRQDDILKAILYVIGQEYETGQVIYVTGGMSVREHD